MKEIAISGSDGIGKTEQIRLLKSGQDDRFHFTGRLVDYTDRWPKVDPVKEFNWWFKEVRSLELVSIIIGALNSRYKACKPDKVNVHDRGVKMFKAVCVATLIAREQMDTEKAIDVVEGVFKRELEFEPIEQDLLFVPNKEYRNKIGILSEVVENRATSYLPWQNRIYEEYQVYLVNLVNHFFQNMHPERVVSVDACILDVQNRLRTLVSSILSSQIPHLCGNLQKVVAFGGLSECGKSSFAQKLSSDCGYVRLKLKYFNEVTRLRCAEPSQSDVGREILNFLQSHQHITKASLESLHGVSLPAYLKLLFGDRMNIVYLDTPKESRILRTAKALGVSECEAKASVEEKDEVKISRGADKVKNIADTIFNNGDEDFEKSFSRFVQTV
ncbi:hypothetical protein A2917_02810 [Candidatus Nomurabacteria bacterium RIFCSPLOWO2_01_FULL_42_17]|uniref:Uncharacterized protein n=1 Tax=Candidatus Nomurabacteria bacterium RIFCSPLOWO2_01_FULL_42_17 TaxID=1801780 RepID=A0A1F6XMY2_9BACT|nr:MAG: hypothetical protein A2917_02810 [Candidatus Nomurabacteria bacterium RIFCSPLOWO2_01_FULL_42_17]